MGGKDFVSRSPSFITRAEREKQRKSAKAVVAILTRSH